MATEYIKRNGIIISVEDWSPLRKKPVLAVSFENENKTYKAASFNDKETAEWFCGVMEEFFGREDNKLGKSRRIHQGHNKRRLHQPRSRSQKNVSYRRQVGFRLPVYR